MSVNEQYESKSEACDAARNITATLGIPLRVVWFPRAIPRRGVVVSDDVYATEFVGQPWAVEIYRTVPTTNA